jgi:hypothetical protein
MVKQIVQLQGELTMTEETNKPEPILVDAQTKLQLEWLQQIHHETKVVGNRLGWLVFFAVLSFLGGLLSAFNALMSFGR